MTDVSEAGVSEAGVSEAADREDPFAFGGAAEDRATDAGHDRPGAVRGQRAGIVVTVALAVTTGYAWFTPFTTPGKDWVAFGCGSLAHPQRTGLARLVCADATRGQTGQVLAWAAATVVAGLAAALLRRRGAALAGVLVAVPPLALGAVVLLSPVVVPGTGGQPLPCGSPVAPTTDRLARGLCSDVPAHRLGQGLWLVLAGLVGAVGVPWAAGAGRGRDA